ncbi:MAG: DUF2339 domain-containing protein [Methyloceanibacter sp.]
MIGSIVFVVLAIPIVAIAAFVMVLNLGGRMRRLEARFAALEARLGGDTAGLAPLVPPVAEPKPDEAKDETPDASTPTPETPPPVPPTPSKPKPSLEERFGTQWVVWAGGIALALGGFFLVRYSIEQGWFGPEARVALGSVIALALIAAGEWTRRNELKSGLAGLRTADIPSVLTAAGTTIAYATIYAAYALYGFVGSLAAFVLLGAVALGTLAASLLHGPALAGLGLVGAYLAPAMVSTQTPNYWALYLYLAVVTAASFALARARLWRWLAFTAVVASVLWVFPGIGDLQQVAPHGFHLASGFALAALLIVSGLIFGPEARQGEIDFVSSGALAAYLFAAMFLVLATGHDTLALIAFVALVVAAVAVAWRTDAASAAVPAAAILVALVFWHWSVKYDIGELGLPAGPAPDRLWEPEKFLFGRPLALGAGLAALFGLSGFFAQRRETSPLVSLLWSASAVTAPIAILIALYWSIAGFDRSIPFASAALVLAAFYAYATEALSRGTAQSESGAARKEQAGAVFATGAIASLALAISLALEKGWLTVALALMVPGIAWIAKKRPWPALRWLAAAVTIALLGRIWWDPRIVGGELGTTPVFNWLLYGYGVPALAFWFAGRMLRRQADDVPSRIVDAAAILATVLLVVFQVRHYVTGGDPYGTGSPLMTAGLQVSLLLAVLIGLDRIRLKTGSIVQDVGAQLLAAGLLLAIAFGLGVNANPLFTGEAVGGRFVNLILLGYGIPAVLTGILAYVTRATRPEFYTHTAAAVALALALAYLTLQVRRFYHGPILTEGSTSDAEQYTYSAVWLVFGVGLLAAGIWYRSLPLRAASAAVVVLTVLKVFLVDMGGLTGIYRALSFLGLGAVLIGIGWFYQRLLFPRPTAAAPAEQG